jgi:hypothetical protein
MKIYWCPNEQLLVSSLGGNRVDRYNWILRDTIAAELFIVERQASSVQPYKVIELQPGVAVIFGAKQSYDDADYLFSQSNWLKTGSGENAKLTGDIKLNTLPLISAGTGNELLVIAEFTLVLPDNSHSSSTQLSVHITRDVNVGGEGIAEVEYMPIQQFTDDDGIKKVRIVNADGVTVFVGAPL